MAIRDVLAFSRKAKLVQKKGADTGKNRGVDHIKRDYGSTF